MPKYILYLNENGDGFSCAVINGLTVEDLDKLDKLYPDYLFKNDLMVLHEVSDNFYYKVPCFDSKGKHAEANYPVSNIPQSIKEALRCKNRRAVDFFINHYLLEAKVDEAKNYFISEDKGALTELVLYHAHFHDGVDADIKNHYSPIGKMHADTPTEMLEFVRYRSTFFQKNFKQGQNYQNTTWLDSSWIMNFISYYSSSFKNNLSYSYIGAYLLGFKPTHFCDDFNKGCKQLDVDMDCNEILNLSSR